MAETFRKPFAAPPSIFAVSLLPAIALGFLLPMPLLPMVLQLLFGPALIVAGVLLIRASMRAIAAAGSTYDPFAASTALTTSGIYRYSRNPGYLGLFVIQIGLALLFDNLWLVLAAIAAAIVTTLFVIRLEEEKLQNSFGTAYRDYCRQVRRWL